MRGFVSKFLSAILGSLFLLLSMHSLSLANEVIYRKPIPSLPITLNTKYFDDAYAIVICYQVFDRLFEVDDLQNLKSHLVERWENSAGGKIWTLHLKKNVLFHNGNPLTAEDVVFSLTRLLDKNSIRSYDLSIIQGAENYSSGKSKTVSGIKILSPNSLQITLKSPFPLFLSMLTTTNTEIIPSKYAGYTENDFFKHPIGTGPFIFESYVPNTSITIRANKNYFLGKPYLDRVVFEKSSAQKALSGFNDGYYQDLEWYIGTDTKLLQTQFALLKITIPSTNTLFFNLSRPPFNNLHVRKAIAYAINREQIINECFPDQLPANGVIPPGIGGYSPDLVPVAYNLDKAKDEIKKSGLNKNQLYRPLVILRPNNHPCVQKFEEIVSKNLAQIGITATVKHLPFSEVDDHYSNRNFDMVNFYISAGFPEALFPLNLFRSNHPRNFQSVRSKKIDDLLTKASQTEDRYGRYGMYREIQEIIQNEALFLPIFHWRFEGIYQPYVKNVELSPYSMLNPSMRIISYDSTYKP